MNYYELQETKEFAAMMELEKVLNNCCVNYEALAESLRFYHPTIQSNFLRFMKACYQYFGNPDRPVDPRNQATKDICQKILEIMDNEPIPYI